MSSVPQVVRHWNGPIHLVRNEDEARLLVFFWSAMPAERVAVFLLMLRVSLGMPFDKAEAHFRWALSSCLPLRSGTEAAVTRPGSSVAMLAPAAGGNR